MTQPKKGRSNGLLPGQFVQLFHCMTKSRPWGELSTNAVWVWTKLMEKFNGFNGDNLSLTYKEVEFKMRSATFKKAKDELLEKGFFKMARGGGLHKQCCLYSISHKWKEAGKEEEK